MDSFLYNVQPCWMCEKLFVYKRRIKVCDICGMRFEVKYSLQRHINLLHETKFLPIHRTQNEDNFICAVCCKQFKTRKSIQRHIAYIHLEKKFECSQCSKKFPCKSKLLRHFKCNCNKKYKQNPTLPEKQIECAVCGEQFKTERKLQFHINRTHNEDNFVCAVCRKQFNTRKSIQQHISHIHLEKKFKCSQCSKNFSRKWELIRHLKNNGREKCNYHLALPKKQNSHSLKCGFCNSYFSSRKRIQHHFQTDHEVALSWDSLHFNSENDFQQFKLNYQRKTSTQFVIRYSHKKVNKTTILYKCHRSGLHEPKKVTIKFPKLKGLKKIQSYCPAEMLVKYFEDGTCVVNFQKIHVGHSTGNQSKLDHIYVDFDEQQKITSIIQLGFSENTIRPEQELANQEIKEKNELHLLNNQNVQDAVANYNIQNEFTLASSDDLINLKAFAEMHTPSILFFKNKSEEDTRFNILANEDFALILMSEFQEMNLLRYGKNIIAFDRTFGVNKYNFILHTLLVMDINYEGVPAAFLISNRNDDTIINIFLQCIKVQIGAFTPRVIMSDMQPTYKNSWIKIMQNEPNFTLWCAWHVREAWNKNYCKVIDKKKREEVKRIILNFAYELDPALFQIKLNEFLSSSDTDLTEFITYFRKQYVENGKSLKWAYCYRRGVGINTDISLKSFHRSLNYYVNRKKMDWLTCILHCIQKYLSIEVNSEDIAFYEANKLKILRQKHHEARKTKDVISKVHEINSNSWLVESFEKQDTTYFIEKREIKECGQFKDVVCRLYCDFCQICFHEYSCNCFDAAIYNNMCKHIHAVGILQSISKTHITDQLAEDNSVIRIITPQTTLFTNSPNKSPHKLERKKIAQRHENETENMNTLKKNKQDTQNWFDDILEKIPNRQVRTEIKKRLLNQLD